MKTLRLVLFAFSLRSAVGARMDSDLASDSEDRFDYESLWSGSDDAVGEVDPANASIPMLLQVAEQHTETNEQKVWLQIAGMFDAGTNLMGVTLEQNLGTEFFNSICPGRDITRQLSDGDMQIRRASYSCHFWKHKDPIAMDPVLEKARDMGVHMVIVAMVRSPLGEITSWEKAPYNLKKCVQAFPLNQDEQRRCKIPRGGIYNGLASVWNHYTRGYEKLAEKYPEHDIRLIEYERLVIEPEAVLADLSAALNRPVRRDIHAISEPAKDHGAPSGRKKALEKILEMEYLNPLDLELRTKICGLLDHEAMEKHVIAVNGSTRSYEADCMGTANSSSFNHALSQRIDALFAN